MPSVVPPDLEIRLLGPFGLHVRGATVLLPPGIERVVAFLGLTERPVPRMRVAEALCPEASEQAALTAVRTYLWRLRQTGLPLVESRSQWVRLNPSVRVDAREVMARARRLAGGFAHIADDLDPRPLTVDLLDGWYDDWVQMERERFRDTRLRALEALARELVAMRRPREAVEAAQAAVAGEPLRESAQFTLMAAQVRAGNLNGAFRQYSSYCELLARELGTRPSAPIEELVAASLD